MNTFQGTNIDQLEAFVASGMATNRQLLEICDELAQRTTPRAAALATLIRGYIRDSTRAAKLKKASPNANWEFPSTKSIAESLRTKGPIHSKLVRCTVCDMPAIPGDSVCFTHNN